MCSRAFVLLLGAVCIYSEVFAAGDVFTGELMVESNITLEAHTILSVLNTTHELQVKSNNDHSVHIVTLLYTELVAECVIIGDDSTCSCSEGYIWSNEVCYTHQCCRETACKKNVSDITPLCIAKVKVHVNGSVILSETTWNPTKTDTLKAAFEELNGFEYLNVTGERESNTIADFEASVSVKFATSTLQNIVTSLETILGAVLWVDTVGMVTIQSPSVQVCYLSTTQLKCTFQEPTGSAGWNITKRHERLELNKGRVVNLTNNCSAGDHESCTEVTLQNVTGIWEGTYECGFTSGSIRHTARTFLRVALLPDVINMKINPLTADCSLGAASVDVTATILNSTESYNVWWSYNGKGTNALSPKNDGDNLSYGFKVDISCQKTTEAQYVNVTFKNGINQEKTAKVDIPVIYAGAKSCSEEVINGEFWPQAPAGDTVINRTCAEGRVGYKSRTCDGTSWQMVFSYCAKQELIKVLNAADKFLLGMGATQEVALDIFAALKNNSASDSDLDASDTMADITASISILNVMSSASKNIVLQEDAFPDFVDAASNMLNKSWDGMNTSTAEFMSSTYLQSVEGLVKNIKVHNNSGLSSQNLDLKFCSGSACNVSVLDINVNLNKSNGMMKTVAVKNLTDKLRNNFRKTKPTGLLMMVTLEENNDSSIEITLDFPQVQLKATRPFCVFWNTTKRDWSDEGCTVKTDDENRTLCTCSHLTSFSVLMSKGDTSNEVLDIITNVGLGVSICSLLIFLLIESLVWSSVVNSNLSHCRHTALVNIAVFLLLANCSFLASSYPENLSSTWCLVLTVCKHLFFLAMFSWMLCMSVMLIHQLIFVFNPLRKRVFMFISSIVGYVCPILIVGCSYVHCKYTNKLYYDPETCWLVFEKLLEGSVHAFLLPVGTVILTNLFAMVVVIVTLMKSGGKADDKESVKSILKVVVFLTPVFGVTWIIGFALIILDDKNSFMYDFANYSFTILNSFQGLSILLTGCIAEQKVRGELLKLIMAKINWNNESMKSLNSTTYTKDK